MYSVIILITVIDMYSCIYMVFIHKLTTFSHHKEQQMKFTELTNGSIFINMEFNLMF